MYSIVPTFYKAVTAVPLTATINGVGPHAHGLVHHLLYGFVLGFLDDFLVCPRASSDYVAYAGEEVAEDIGSHDTGTGYYSVVGCYLLVLQSACC